MKPTESQIEELLRHAPRPAAPTELRDKLTGQIQLPTRAAASVNGVSSLHPRSWWQRWWPALAPATASVACAVVIAVQQNEIATLQQTVRGLNAALTAATNSPPDKIQAPPTSSVGPAAETEAEEIARLQQRAASLTAEIGRLEAVQQVNAGLRSQISAPVGFSQPELDALAAAKERAQSIACINNLKQIGLAVRIYADDYNGVNPPDFLSMSNELGSPKILFCPASTNHPSVKTWTDFAATVASYEFLAAGVTNAAAEPQRILTRCPIHNNIGLCDGSVQKVGKDHPEWTVERDGKLYFEVKSSPAKTNP